MYKQSHPRAGISIECRTERVPADGRYHLIKGEQIIGSFRNLKLAQAEYKKLVDALDLPPLVDQNTKMTKEQIEDLYFSSSKATGFVFKPQPSGRNKHPK